MIKDGESGHFNLQNATFSTVLVVFVRFRLLTYHYVGPYNFAHTPHELLLCIIGSDVDRNPTLAEAVMENFIDVHA